MRTGCSSSLAMLESRLAASLQRDRAKRSRRSLGDDGVVVVRPSGTSCGLALAISLVTGEDDEAVMDRVANASAAP